MFNEWKALVYVCLFSVTIFIVLTVVFTPICLQATSSRNIFVPSLHGANFPVVCYLLLCKSRSTVPHSAEMRLRLGTVWEPEARLCEASSPV